MPMNDTTSTDGKVSLNSIRTRFAQVENMELACELTLTVQVSMIHPLRGDATIDSAKVVGAIHILEDDNTGVVGGMADITLSNAMPPKKAEDYSIDDIAAIFDIKPDAVIWEVGDAG